jgi:hypothetical protein
MKVQRTPYQKIKASKPAQVVRENKLVTGLATAGAAVVVAGGAAQSAAFANVAQYGIAPAVGAGLAAFGAAAAHDAVVNDIAERPVFGTAKFVGGAAAALGGAQVVGLAYDIPGLDRALTTPLSKLAENGQAVLGLAVSGGGVAAGKFAADKFQQAFAAGENRTRNVALGTAAATTSAAAVLGGAELVGRNFSIPVVDQALTGTVRALASGGAGSVAAGTLLTGGAAQLGAEALKNFRKGGNDLLTAVEAMGAVTAGLGGVQLAGHGLGLQATQGLLTEHAPVVASTGASALGLALTRTSVKSMGETGLRPLNSLGLAAGAAMIPAGAAGAAAALGLHEAAELFGRSAGTAAGLGLGVATAALGKQAVESAKHGQVLHTAGYGLAAAGTATGALFAVGESLNIPVMREASRKVLSSTLEPAFEHVISPATEFLFTHPVAGGAVLALGVGGYLYARYRSDD